MGKHLVNLISMFREISDMSSNPLCFQIIHFRKIQALKAGEMTMSFGNKNFKQLFHIENMRFNNIQTSVYWKDTLRVLKSIMIILYFMVIVFVFKADVRWLFFSLK